MDLRMPQMSGVDVTVAICAEFARAHIMLTTHDGDKDIYHTLEPEVIYHDAEPMHLNAIHVVYSGVNIRLKLLPNWCNAWKIQSDHREQEIVHSMADGLSNHDIGTVLNITEKYCQIPISTEFWVNWRERSHQQSSQRWSGDSPRRLNLSSADDSPDR